MKKTIKIFTILIVVFFIFASMNIVRASNATTGHTAEEVGQQIANWSIEFYKEHKDQCSYDDTFGAPRRAAYNAPIDYTTSYCFDCVGWISFAVHHSTGLGGETFVVFAQPQRIKSGTTAFNGFYEFQKDVRVYNEQQGLDLGLRPGDVLIKSELHSKVKGSGHVGLYVGNDTVLHSISSGLVADTVADFVNIGDGEVIDYIARVKDESASNANFEFVPGGAILPPSGSASASGEEFEFNGLPNTVSYTKPGGLDWLFDQISQFFSFLAGMIINVIKYSILGYAGLVQTIVGGTIEWTEEPLSNTTNTVNTVEVSYVQPIEASSGTTVIEEQQEQESNESTTNNSNNEEDEDNQAITLEDVIYNKIPILDVNIFTNTPGGKTVPQDSVVNIVRQIISTWYVSFRNLSIMALAVIIIYLGIRIALSTIPEKTSQYKTALLSWVVSIMLVFTIHYFMVIVFNINESIVSLFADTGGEEALFDTIQTRAMDIRMDIGIPATIMYIVLQVYLLKFLWIYVKRYLAIMILIVLAPFICAKYAFDSAKGKRGSSLTSWMYDFTLNVLLQSVHALLYTALMGIAIEISLSNLWGFIIALVFINFISKADKIFMDIFDFGRGGSVKEVDKQFSKDEDLAGALFFWQVGKRGAKFVGNAVPAMASNTKRTVSRLRSDISYKLHEDESYEMMQARVAKKNARLDKKDEFMNNVYRKIHMGRDSEKRQLMMMARKSGEVGRRARKTLQKQKELKKKRYTTRKDTIKNLVTGIGGMGVAIPAFVISPKLGYTLMNKSIKKYRKLSRPEWKGEGYKKKYHGTAKLAQISSLGLYGVIKNYNEAKGKQEKKEGEVTKTIGYIKQVDGYSDKATEKWEEVKRDIAGMYQEGKPLTKEQERQVREETIGDVKFAVLDTSNNMIKDSINNFTNVNEQDNINNENIDEIIDSTLTELGVKDKYSEEKIEKIKEAAKQSFDYGTDKFTEQVKSLASGIHESIINFGIEDKNVRELAVQFDNIEKINEEARKEVKTRIVDTERMIDSVRFQ